MIQPVGHTYQNANPQKTAHQLVAWPSHDWGPCDVESKVIPSNRAVLRSRSFQELKGDHRFFVPDLCTELHLCSPNGRGVEAAHSISGDHQFYHWDTVTSLDDRCESLPCLTCRSSAETRAVTSQTCLCTRDTPPENKCRTLRQRKGPSRNHVIHHMTTYYPSP